MLRFLTAGESHGQALLVTVDGMPAGLQLDIDALNLQLRRRQGGYGRGRRMQIESDRAEVLSGVRHGVTTGAPIALLIRNRDWVNWQQTMYVEAEKPEGATGAENRPDVTRPRPGHADLAGAIKYGHSDIRDVLERAGLEFDARADRALQAALGEDFVALFVNARDIPEFVADGAADIGITGRDLVEEEVSDFEERLDLVLPLGFGHADVVVACARRGVHAIVEKPFTVTVADDWPTGIRTVLARAE